MGVKYSVERFLDNFRSLETQRVARLKLAPDGPLKDFLSVPLADLKLPISEQKLLAVDFETTGLDANNDHILSIGFINIDKNTIKLGSSYHQVVTTKKTLNPNNVTIHKITDKACAEGASLGVVVEDLLLALAGRVMLVHYAAIERAFLQQACLKLYGIAPVFLVIDTLELAKRRYDRTVQAYQPMSLHLFNLRAEYGLPLYKQHNALNDAIATAELFITELQHTEHRGMNSLKTFIR